MSNKVLADDLSLTGTAEGSERGEMYQRFLSQAIHVTVVPPLLLLLFPLTCWRRRYNVADSL